MCRLWLDKISLHSRGCIWYTDVELQRPLLRPYSVDGNGKRRSMWAFAIIFRPYNACFFVMYSSFAAYKNLYYRCRRFTNLQSKQWLEKESSKPLLLLPYPNVSFFCNFVLFIFLPLKLYSYFHYLISIPFNNNNNNNYHY